VASQLADLIGREEAGQILRGATMAASISMEEFQGTPHLPRVYFVIPINDLPSDLALFFELSDDFFLIIIVIISRSVCVVSIYFIKWWSCYYMHARAGFQTQLLEVKQAKYESDEQRKRLQMGIPPPSP
jgi:hypothetical protein